MTGQVNVVPTNNEVQAKINSGITLRGTPATVQVNGQPTTIKVMVDSAVSVTPDQGNAIAIAVALALVNPKVAAANKGNTIELPSDGNKITIKVNKAISDALARRIARRIAKTLTRVGSVKDNSDPQPKEINIEVKLLG